MAYLDEGVVLRMKARHAGIAGAMAGVILLNPWLASARIFRNSGVATGSDVSSLGRVLYTAAMEVDGSPRQVSVVAPSAESGASGVRTGSAGKGSMEIASMPPGAGPVRVLTLRDPDKGKALVIAVEGAPGRGEPDRVVQPATVFPAYRGAVVRKVIRNADTRTTMEIRETADDPDAVLRHYRSALARAGWAPVGLRPDGAAGEGLAGFWKGGDVCWILCRRAESGGETRVTLLHKRGAMNGMTGDR